MKGVRFRDDGFEGQCDYCKEFLPLTREFWTVPGGGLRRCKVCFREYKRLHQAGYKGDLRQAIWRENQRARLRLITTEEHERRLAANRAWKARNRERIAAYNRAYKARAKGAA